MVDFHGEKMGQSVGKGGFQGGNRLGHQVVQELDYRYSWAEHRPTLRSFRDKTSTNED